MSYWTPTMLSEWLFLPGPQPFRKTAKFSLFIYILSHLRTVMTKFFWELSWSISRLHLNSRADSCCMIWPKVVPCKASRPMDLLEYSITISPGKHSGFCPVGYLVGGRENNVHLDLTGVCFGKHLNVELRNYSTFLVIHPISTLYCWKEENSNFQCIQTEIDLI